ncbi:alpha/beta hydrolase [Chenggangzhangella methanolivorans]|uniref:Lysophospholipase n=1 Tax=Chenggangzhangella methanolivorans TaxID=1437009 RepID=A0A9E6UKL6_9HYPH|nr:lysophospholipase [Chenggangzhangella methanolivorans]QZN99476.1 lysophospholipase [Chenggangzhangella methanolivorans]
MVLAQDRLTFHPRGEMGPPAAFGLDDFQRVTFRTDDGVDLVGWLHEAAKNDKAILYFYGNADALPPYAGFFRALAEAGYTVLGVNYRGYGGSAGSPSEAGLYKDADAALAFLTQRVPSERVTVMGRSLGSGVAVDLAARNSVRSLVLISPFTSVTDVAAEIYWFLPVRLLAGGRFDSLADIRKVSAPILMLHGDRDTLIAPEQARRLLAAANEPKRLEILEGADHIGIDFDRVFRSLVAFERGR